MTLEDDYRKKMIKSKKEYDEYKAKEGDSDLIFNEKDHKNQLKKNKF